MKHLLKSTALLFIFVLANSFAFAQADAPLFLNGQFSVDESGVAQQAMERIHCEYPDAHPDGGFFYSSDYALEGYVGIPLSVDLTSLDPVQPFINFAPTNVWVCRVDTGEVTLTAEQPEGLSFSGTTSPTDVYQRAGLGKWSPDGTVIILERTIVRGNGYEDDLLVYNLVDGTNFSLPGASITGRNEGVWIDGGFVAFLGDTVTAYNFDGSQRWTKSQLAYYGDLFNIKDGETDAIGLMTQTSGWQLIDPVTGDLRPMNGIPEQYNAAAPEGISIALVFEPNERDYTFPIYENSAAASPIGDLLPEPSRLWEAGIFAIAPNSTQIAFLDLYSTPTLWRLEAGSPTTTPIDTSLVADSDGYFYAFSVDWGQQAMRVRPQ